MRYRRPPTIFQTRRFEPRGTRRERTPVRMRVLANTKSQTMEVEFVDGWDMTDFFALKYPDSVITFQQGQITDGRPGPPGSRQGKAVTIFNTASGVAEYTYVLRTGAKPQLWAGRDLMIRTAFKACNWLQFSYAGGVILSLQLRADGKMEVRKGTGTVLGIIPFQFQLATWYYIEVNVIFGTSASYEIWIEDVKEWDQSGVGLVANLPDRITYRVDTGADVSWTHDNINYASSDPVETLSNRRGPQRVTGLYPIALGIDQWNLGAGANSLYAIADSNFGSGYAHVPDGEGTYLQPASLNVLELVQMLKSPCFGRNYAVAVNACAKPITGAQSLDLVLRQRTLTTNVGTHALTDFGTQFTTLPALQGYGTYQSIIELSPATGLVFTDAEISNALWGARGLSTDQHLTQLYIEKLTSIDPTLPFDCGSFSYAF